MKILYKIMKFFGLFRDQMHKCKEQICLKDRVKVSIRMLNSSKEESQEVTVMILIDLTEF